MRTKQAGISPRIGSRARWNAPATAALALVAATCGSFGTAGASVVPAAAGAARTPTIAPALASTVEIRVGKEPVAVAVNPNTDKIYVTNKYSDSVTVIDGKTNKTTTVHTYGKEPVAVAVNLATNKIYVTDQKGVDAKGVLDPNGNGTVTVIDGATNKTTKVAAGLEPGAVAINEKTNKIYVTNEGGNEVTVIDGKTNKPTTVQLRKDGAGLEEGVLSPHDVKVNPVTNKIYVTGPQSNTVGVIDGATNKLTVIKTETGPKTGFTPTRLAINPKTNQIYVTDYTTNDVTVIDGKTDKISAMPIPPYVQDTLAVAVNPNTNKIYVANHTSKSITVFDGATKKGFTIGDLPGKPHDVAINTVTNKIYFPTYFLYRGATTGDDEYITGVVEELDGATNTLSTAVTGNGPVAVAVNEKTNKTYIVNQYSGTVTVLTEPTSGGKASVGKASVAPTSAISADSRPFAPAATAALPPTTRSRALRPLN